MVSKICRVCLNNTASLCIFDKQDEIQLSTKIMKCVNVFIADGDGMPDSICETCAGDLSTCYEFVIKCEASDSALRCFSFNAGPLDEERQQDLFDNYANDEKPELFDDVVDEKEISLCEDSAVDKKGLLDDYAVNKKEILFDDIIYSTVDSTILKENKTEVKRKKRKSWKSNPIKCDICGFEALCFEYLKVHMQDHTKEKPFSCNVCDSAFILKDMLNRHIRNKHNKIQGKNNVKKQKTGPIQCVVCGLIVQSNSALEAHSRTHTGEKPFSCDLCDMRFRVKSALKKHTEKHHMERERKYTCETCGSSFYSKADIVIHIRRHTGERPYSCKMCGKSFIQASSLIRHRVSHTGERNHSCPICLKMFNDKWAVQKHLSVHSDERKYSCHLCNRSVKSKSSLVTHLKLHSNEKQHICFYCGSSFTLKGNLQIHINRKHSEKSGDCLICRKTFSDLEEHMRTHTGEKPFTCNLCNQAYGKKRSLAYHIMYRHKNADKYKCSVGECVRTFPNGKLLEVHLLKEHAKHTPYICPHCSKGFFRNSDLTRHLRCSHMDTKIVLKTNVQEIDKITLLPLDCVSTLTIT